MAAPLTTIQPKVSKIIKNIQTPISPNTYIDFVPSYSQNNTLSNPSNFNDANQIYAWKVHSKEYCYQEFENTLKEFSLEEYKALHAKIMLFEQKNIRINWFTLEEKKNFILDKYTKLQNISSQTRGMSRRVKSKTKNGLDSGTLEKMGRQFMLYQLASISISQNQNLRKFLNKERYIQVKNEYLTNLGQPIKLLGEYKGLTFSKPAQRLINKVKSSSEVIIQVKNYRAENCEIQKLNHPDCCSKWVITPEERQLQEFKKKHINLLNNYKTILRSEFLDNIIGYKQLKIIHLSGATEEEMERNLDKILECRLANYNGRDVWKEIQRKNLNFSQKKSVLNSLEQDFTLIQGPPGTGKTLTSVYIVKSLIKFVNNDKHKMPIYDKN